jgi:hypothetical protein
MALYERQAIDTDESFAAFQSYRDQRPPRRLDRIIAANVRVPIAKSSAWYREHGWRERVAAWDAHLDDIRREEIEAVERASAVNAAQVIADLLTASQVEAAKLLAQTEVSAEVSFMKPRDIAALAETAIKLRRLEKGQATERLEVEDLSGASVEKLRELRAELRRKA